MYYLMIVVMKGFRHWLSPPLSNQAIKLQGFGYHEAMQPGIVDRPSGTGDILIMLLHTTARIGTGIEANTYPPSHAIIWRAGAKHYYGCEDSPWDHTWIHCDGPAMRRVLRNTSMPMDKPVYLSNPMIVEQAVIALHEEVCNHSEPDIAIIANTLDTLVRSLARQIKSVKNSAAAIPSAILRVRHHIDSHFEQPLRLEYLAEYAGVSVSHLSAEFRRCYSMPPIEYLIRQRLSRAAYLLLDRNLTVAQVAERVGYDDPFHFSKLFKKRYGQSPKQFRSVMD